MNPILYAKDETNFESFGIGVLSDTISCVVTQDAGCYELEMEYPIGGVHYESIEHSCWLKVICPPMLRESPQLFYIVHISKPLSKKVTITAHHVSYKLNFIPIKRFTARTVNDLFLALKPFATEEFPFTFESNMGQRVINMINHFPVSAMSILGGSDQSLLSILGGEFLWDNYTVVYKDEIGRDLGYEIRYGVNVTDLKQEENIAETITGIVPYWYQEGDDPTNPLADMLVMLPETTLYADNYKDFPFNRSVPVDFSNDLEATYNVDNNLVPPTWDQLEGVAREYIRVNGIGVPKVSIDVSMEDMYQSKEYHHLFNYEAGITNRLPHLYDIVTVIFPLLHIKKKAKIVKTVFDVINQKYVTITIGDKKNTVVEKISNVTDDIAEDVASEVASEVSKANKEISKQVDLRYQEIQVEVVNLEEEMNTEIAEAKVEARSYTNSVDTTLRNKIDSDLAASTEALMGGRGGYVVMNQSNTTSPPHVDEILIMDAPTRSAAQKIISLNKNGIGFSSNGGQSYNSTWTIDGTFIAQQLDAKTINSLKITSATIDAGTIKTGTLQAITIDSGVDSQGNVRPSYIRSAVIEAGRYMTFNYNNESSTGRVTVGSGSVLMKLTSNATYTTGGTVYTGQMFQSTNPGSYNTYVGGGRDAVIIDANAFAVSSKGFAIAACHYAHWAGITVENIENSGAVLILQNRDLADAGTMYTNYSRITLAYGRIELIWGGQSDRVTINARIPVTYNGHTYYVPAEY